VKTKEELYSKALELESERERLRLLYMWVKQNQITQGQFIEYILSGRWKTIKFKGILNESPI
jgi:hypothetical protein